MAAAAAAAHIEGSSSPDDHINYSSQSSSDDPMPESNSPSTSSSSSSSSARANRFFPDQVVDILNRWFVQNADYPYPDEHMTNVLAKEANISAKQVRKWFANKRVRSNKCFKQTFKAKKEAVANRARLHAKSMSDMDSMYLPAGEISISDNDEATPNGQFQIPPKYEPLKTSPLSSSMSSSSSSSFVCSPTHRSEQSSPLTNGSFSPHHLSSSSPATFGHTGLSSSCNGGRGSGGQLAGGLNAASFAAAAAYYNPYFLMNFFQQQIQRNQVSGQFDSSPVPNSPLIKRKTHLSNCFMQDLTKETVVRSEDNGDTCLLDSTNQSPQVDGLQMWHKPQSQPEYPHNQENKQPTLLVRKTKINFGDISDLIN